MNEGNRITLHKEKIMSLKRYSKKCFLADGTPILIRAIKQSDRQRLSEGFHHLSSQSIFYRFFRRKKDLSEEELRYFTEVDFDHHVAIVAAIMDGDKEDDIGVARFVEIQTHNPERVAEFALAIEDEYQNKGVGTLLFKHLVSIAQQQGFSKLIADVLLDNKGMMRILKNSGFILKTTIDQGIAHVELKIKE